MRTRILFLITYLCRIHFAQALDKYIYPAPESPTDTRHNDLIEITQLALERTKSEYGPYTLVQATYPMNEARCIMEVKKKGSVNLVWSSTSEEKENSLLPILIPLRKGLLGYRVAIINEEDQSKIDQIKTIDDLKKLTFVQGTGWGDSQLYKHNGIQVLEAEYESLFSVINLKRANLFPRGISEAYEEHEARKEKLTHLKIEKNLLIYYPWPFYVFFNKTDAHLKNRLEKGIKILIEDGTFDKIFLKYNSKWIEKAQIKKRRIIELKNPLLPKSAPLHIKKYWYHP